MWEICDTVSRRQTNQTTPRTRSFSDRGFKAPSRLTPHYLPSAKTLEYKDRGTVDKNSAKYGGGLYLENGSTTTLNTVTIQNNILNAGGLGKGIYQHTTEAKLTQTAVTDPDGLYTST